MEIDKQHILIYNHDYNYNDVNMKYLLVPVLIILSAIPAQAQKTLCRMETKNPIIRAVGNVVHADVPKCAKDKPVEKLEYDYVRSIWNNTGIWKSPNSNRSYAKPIKGVNR
jgi:hypothetical protein